MLLHICSLLSFHIFFYLYFLMQNQMRVKLEGISVSFSQEEWAYLDERQKELHREVMKENYELLRSLANEMRLKKEKREEQLLKWKPYSSQVDISQRTERRN
uniref:Zinc finger protein 37A-like isoform X2 n=1 Tax=Geotrypetes seraphini TaxID=260995 RepID=A0A6P8PJ01_GEOSA|nr:zinc finger protein 37A-like isoform X2 [Geotrypetes seraphini]